MDKMYNMFFRNGSMNGVTIIVVMVFAIVFSQQTSYDVKHISAEEAYALLNNDNILVLDVRERRAFDKEHIPNAVVVPIGELENRLQEFESHKAERIVVYCNEGSQRGPKATDALNKAGYTEAVNLKGGIESWRSARYPTVK